MVLLASDLDNTMIYSYRKPIGDRVLVEEWNEKPLSYMTAYAWEQMRSLPSEVSFLPVTTRSREQYDRIRLPLENPPEFALVSNGGILMRQGRMDEDWYEESLSLAGEAGEEMKRAQALMEADSCRSLEVRMVDGLFLFTKSGPELPDKLEKELDSRKVRVHSHGQKIYVLPAGLNKGNMLRRLRERMGCPPTISCGDSQFDIPMLLEADTAIFPKSLEREMREAFSPSGNREGSRTGSSPPHWVTAGDDELLSDRIFRYLSKRKGEAKEFPG